MAADHIKQQTVVAQVMGEIRNLIASNAYAPGDKIPTEKELAEKFGIGRSSIREAIKIFNYLGVLQSRAALGTFVQDRSNISTEALTWSLLLGSDELEDIIDMRGSIELWCLVKLVDSYREGRQSAQGTVAELENIVRDMEEASKENRRETLIDDDYRFHFAIIKSSSTPLFISIYETLRSFLHHEIKASQDDYDDTSLIYKEHESLLKAIKSGQKSTIMLDYINHIDNIKMRLKHREK
ncbi:MAG: GntR family transcriptional regulator [Spirochaetaceae bacterium]|nr:GntR family transcriptional regulator [Spirochaetaceae bacterium]MDT8297809.1 GntR family transcriptional regulator [Spirochaetaceae bacterium]